MSAFYLPNQWIDNHKLIAIIGQIVMLNETVEKMDNPGKNERMKDLEIVIIGGGIAGINLAKKLGGKKGMHITLVDKNNYNFFTPLLY